ncbi:DUF3455 domain-containing protein [Virgisporangium ochraceum]|uniref:DUF3455 domain-containing protein n=1 Tax=Virgisporangium ochraceum TaxID=65505 RepID=A0A8J3ZX35_9ACTN|nr:DUF3455 domain-containing protein [Virgisporangium ochraceum]GIJ69095.1 hypothetical protein Voc01_040120 [Virgisporangium ochraceum]
MVDIKRKYRIGAAVAAAVLAGGLAGTPAQAAPAAPAAPSGGTVFGGTFTLPAGAPTPGDGFVVKSAYRVVAGVQEYACTDAGTWATASTPTAVLLKYGSLRAIYHYAGPRWRALDGSTLLGAVATRVPKDGTIPWLLLTTTVEKGKPGQELSNVTHISRVNTSGGVGPTGACTAGTTQKVPYGADYVFWAPTG